MDAVVIAGGIPAPQDRLYTYSRGESKALLDIAGKPMVQWVLDALGESKGIDRVVLIGLTSKSGLTCKKPLFYVSNQGKMLANIQTGTAKVLELNPKAEYVLFSTSDIPAVSGNMIDWVINNSLQTRHDLYYTVIPRQVMEDRFPTARRTFVRLKDLEACGADVQVVRASIVHKNSDFWDRLIEARKNPAAQASILGLDIILRFIFRQLTADDIIRKVAERLGLKGRALISPYAELGMDVDKPHQLELMRAELSAAGRRRARAGTAIKSSARRPRRASRRGGTTTGARVRRAKGRSATATNRKSSRRR